MASILGSWRGVRPSYKGGYARSASESIAPQQWRGLVAAYCASLGPTGLTPRDVSGHGHHGVLFGPFLPSEIWAREPGGLNMGMTFHYPGNAFRRIIAGSGSGSSVPFPAFVDKTYSMWVRSEDNAAIRTLLTFGVDSPAFRLGVGKIDIKGNLAGNTVVTEGEWNHLAATSGPSGSVAYMNGQPDGTGSRNTQSATSLQIGWSSGVGVNQLTGAMEDIRIYNRELSAAEIREIYELGPAGMFIQKPRVFGLAVAAAAGSILPHDSLSISRLRL